MPYIITTNRPTDRPRAYATVHEAKAHVYGVVGFGPEHGFFAEIDQHGGAVGPLRDGTVIKVKPVTATRLAALLGMIVADRVASAMGVQTLVDDYNDAQGE